MHSRFEARALGYKSSVDQGTPPSFLRDGSGGGEQIIIHAMDGAGFWAVRALFGKRTSFDRVPSQYKSFSGLDIEPVIPAIEAAMKSPRFDASPMSTMPDNRTIGIVAGALACQRVIEKVLSVQCEGLSSWMSSL